MSSSHFDTPTSKRFALAKLLTGTILAVAVSACGAEGDQRACADHDGVLVCDGTVVEEASFTSRALSSPTEREYRQLVGEEIYAETKNMSASERQDYLDEMEYRQLVGEEIYAETKNMTDEERAKYLADLEKAQLEGRD